MPSFRPVAAGSVGSARQAAHLRAGTQGQHRLISEELQAQHDCSIAAPRHGADRHAQGTSRQPSQAAQAVLGRGGGRRGAGPPGGGAGRAPARLGVRRRRRLACRRWQLHRRGMGGRVHAAPDCQQPRDAPEFVRASSSGSPCLRSHTAGQCVRLLPKGIAAPCPAQPSPAQPHTHASPAQCHHSTACLQRLCGVDVDVGAGEERVGRGLQAVLVKVVACGAVREAGGDREVAGPASQPERQSAGEAPRRGPVRHAATGAGAGDARPTACRALPACLPSKRPAGYLACALQARPHGPVLITNWAGGSAAATLPINSATSLWLEPPWRPQSPTCGFQGFRVLGYQGSDNLLGMGPGACLAGRRAGAPVGWLAGWRGRARLPAG